MKYYFFLVLFFSFLSLSLEFNSQAHASDWSIIEYGNDKGINALTNNYNGRGKSPIWSTLIVDFGISRKCAPGLGFMIRNNSNLGQIVEIK